MANPVDTAFPVIGTGPRGAVTTLLKSRYTVAMATIAELQGADLSGHIYVRIKTTDKTYKYDAVSTATHDGASVLVDAAGNRFVIAVGFGNGDFLADGSIPATGAFNLGGYNISNIGDIGCERIAAASANYPYLAFSINNNHAAPVNASFTFSLPVRSSAFVANASGSFDIVMYDRNNAGAWKGAALSIEAAGTGSMDNSLVIGADKSVTFGGEVKALGRKVTLDADADTFIQVTTDDQLDITLGGVLTHQFTRTLASFNRAPTAACGAEFGANRASNNNVIFDFVGDITYTDYGLRLFRPGVVNANGQLINRGTGELRLVAEDAGAISFHTNSIERIRIGSTGLPHFPSISTTASAANAFLDSGSSPANELKRSTSSLEYKTGWEDLDSNRIDAFLEAIRPIWWRSELEADKLHDGKPMSFYGFGAEHLDKIDPRLAPRGYMPKDMEWVKVGEEPAIEKIREKVKVKRKIDTGKIDIFGEIDFDEVEVEEDQVILKDVTKDVMGWRPKKGAKPVPDGININGVVAFLSAALKREVAARKSIEDRLDALEKNNSDKQVSPN